MKPISLKQAVLSFVLFAVLASMVQLLGAQHNINPAISLTAFTTLVVIAGIQKSKSLSNSVFHQAGIQVELWVVGILDRFWSDNVFLKYFYDHKDFVVGGRIVHIPQPGTKPVVRKNRSSYPATAIRRTDTDITYVLDEYTTDPTHIPHADTVELSYDKTQSVLKDHTGGLFEDVAEDFIIKILTDLPQANVVDTTGADVAVGFEGQTGTRKAVTLADIKAIKLRMDKQKVSKKERYALMDVDMLKQLTDEMTEAEYNRYHKFYDVEKGILGMIEGFTILDRDTVALAATALSSGKLVVNELGAAVSATDDVVSMFWQKDCAAQALGEVRFFETLNDAGYYGDVYSALLRMGGRRRFENDEGVFALKQGHTA